MQDRVRGVGAASVLHYFFEPYAEGGPGHCGGSSDGTPLPWCAHSTHRCMTPKGIGQTCSANQRLFF